MTQSALRFRNVRCISAAVLSEWHGESWPSHTLSIPHSYPLVIIVFDVAYGDHVRRKMVSTLPLKASLSNIWRVFTIPKIWHVHLSCEATLRTGPRLVPPRYDRNGDFHYDLISALHKSLRGGQLDSCAENCTWQNHVSCQKWALVGWAQLLQVVATNRIFRMRRADWLSHRFI